MASGKSLEKPPVREAVLHYNKNGLPVRNVDENGFVIERVRMSKKERLRRRREEKEDEQP
jgi:hypothetical protein